MSPKKEILQTKPIKTSREISYEQNCFLFFAFRRHGEEKVVVDGIFFFLIGSGLFCGEKKVELNLRK